MPTKNESSYEVNRLNYISAQETINNLHESLAKVERQAIDRFINEAKVFASTLTTHELVVKNHNLNFIAIDR